MTPARRFAAADCLRAWAPAVLWATLMSYASTDAFSSQATGRFVAAFLRWLDPAVTAAHVEVVNVVARKCAHVVEYLVLYLLVYRGLAAGRTPWRASRALGGWFIVAAYAALDEFHQSFVASRTASPWDALLDSAGATVGLLALYFWMRFRRPRAAAARFTDGALDP